MTSIDIGAHKELSPEDTVVVTRLVALAEQLGLDPEDLDMAVHDAASIYATDEANSSGAVVGEEAWHTIHEDAGRQAAGVNNGGVSRQVGYLVQQLGAEQVESMLREFGGPQPWTMPLDWFEALNLESEGWTEFRHGRFTEVFPEVADRRMPGWQRDFWLRDGDRLIIEWGKPASYLDRRVEAVLLNGEIQRAPKSLEEWGQVWRRHGGDGLTSCGGSCCDGFRRGERMDG